MLTLGPSYCPSISTVDNTRSEKEQTFLRIQQEVQTISQNHRAFINHVDSLLKQDKQPLELRSSTQMSQRCPSSSQQQNQLSMRPTPISLWPLSCSQPGQPVSFNQTATIRNLQQPRLLPPLGPTRSATPPTLLQNSQQQEPSQPTRKCRDFKAMLKEIETIMSNIVGLEGIKSQIRKWSLRLLQDEKRRALGLDVGPRKTLHMAFLGNPGTGKTMIARTLGKVLHLVGLISKEEVTEVQRTDLVGEFIGQTGLKTREKIKQASGGILFVDEAYRLMPKNCTRDLGIEALEEIMAAMNRKDIVIIFAGYNVEMNRVISANPGLFRRVSNKFYFDDYTLIDMARILHLKMNTKERDSFTYGYRLDSNCSVEAIAELIGEHTTEEQRKKLNGGIVDPLLVNALEHLDLRLDIDCTDASSLLTITMEDLKAGLKSLDKSMNHNNDCLPQKKTVGIRFDRPRAVDVGDDLDCLPPTKRRNICYICSDRSHPAEVGDGAHVGSSNGATSPKNKLEWC